MVLLMLACMRLNVIVWLIVKWLWVCNSDSRMLYAQMTHTQTQTPTKFTSSCVIQTYNTMYYMWMLRIWSQTCSFWKNAFMQLLSSAHVSNLVQVRIAHFSSYHASQWNILGVISHLRSNHSIVTVFGWLKESGSSWFVLTQGAIALIQLHE